MVIAASMMLCLNACGQKKATESAKARTLVTYFSATGTTQRVAEQIADITGGKLVEIKPVQAYTSADLNWRDANSRSTVEMTDSASRPAIEQCDVDMNLYDTVFIGYPIWWDKAPRVINTFIESVSLDGKTVIPFATSGGSGIDNSVKMLQSEYPDINWREGKLLNGRVTKETINEMLNN